MWLGDKQSVTQRLRSAAAAATHNNVAGRAGEARLASALECNLRALSRLPQPVSKVQQVVAHLASHLTPHTISRDNKKIDNLLW